MSDVEYQSMSDPFLTCTPSSFSSLLSLRRKTRGGATLLAPASRSEVAEQGALFAAANADPTGSSLTTSPVSSSTPLGNR